MIDGEKHASLLRFGNNYNRKNIIIHAAVIYE
jgi:hypothetical protein